MTLSKIFKNRYSHPLDKLKDIMSILRSEIGCPWDKEQTHKTLVPCLLEESYEVVDAIEREDYSHLKEELGDLLFQSVFHSRLAEESGHFNLEEVIEGISNKLIHRHPHVFASLQGIESSEDVVNQWDSIKEKEKPINNSLLDSVPRALPAIQRSEKIQSKVSKVGFDWEKWQEPIGKLWEEVGELKEELNHLVGLYPIESRMNKNEIPSKLLKRIESEIGDVIFSIVNVARHLGLDSEKCLRQTNDKFSKRFQFIESESKNLNKNLKDMSLEEMDLIWKKAKDAGI